MQDKLSVFPTRNEFAFFRMLGEGHVLKRDSRYESITVIEAVTGNIRGIVSPEGHDRKIWAVVRPDQKLVVVVQLKYQRLFGETSWRTVVVATWEGREGTHSTRFIAVGDSIL